MNHHPIERIDPVACSSLKPIQACLAVFASLLAAPAGAGITYERVTVGNAGNAGDTMVGANTFGFGAVAYDYQIGKYDVTIGQYTAFLNAVAATDTYSLYNSSMGTDLNIAGIARSGTSGAYTYSVINNGGNSANRPITYVSWWDSARFSNWMANGQPTGAQSSTTTENGAYNVNGATSGNAPAKNVTNPNTSAAPTFYIPTENEWYKAAYYSPTLNSGSGGYYTFATQSNTAPGNSVVRGTNDANYAPGGNYSVTHLSYSASQNYLFDVGVFFRSGSFYGTFDQSGSVSQWNDLNGTSGSFRGLRGGGWSSTSYTFLWSSSSNNHVGPSDENHAFGFRLASPFAVPEPSTWVMGAVGLACVGWGAWRRRYGR